MHVLDDNLHVQPEAKRTCLTHHLPLLPRSAAGLYVGEHRLAKAPFVIQQSKRLQSSCICCCCFCFRDGMAGWKGKGGSSVRKKGNRSRPHEGGTPHEQLRQNGALSDDVRSASSAQNFKDGE